MPFCISAQKKSPSAPSSSQILPQLFLKALSYLFLSIRGSRTRKCNQAHPESMGKLRFLGPPRPRAPDSGRVERGPENMHFSHTPRELLVLKLHFEKLSLLE